MTWAPDYVTSAELKAELRITDAVDDTQIARWVTAASRAVDDWAHRQFGKVAALEARTYTADWDPHLGVYVAEVDDLYDATGLTITADSVAVTEYTLYPRNALQKGMVYERLYWDAGAGGAQSRDLVVTGLWGWSAVPTNIKQATLLQASRFAARRDSPYGVAGSPAEGSEIRLLAAVDPDVKVAIGKKYRREWWAA